MSDYEEMYKKFKIEEDQKAQFKEMSEALFLRPDNIIQFSIKTIVNNHGREEIKNTEIVDAKLV